jgi:hypothetical protein
MLLQLDSVCLPNILSGPLWVGMILFWSHDMLNMLNSFKNPVFVILNIVFVWNQVKKKASDFIKITGKMN